MLLAARRRLARFGAGALRTGRRALAGARYVALRARIPSRYAALPLDRLLDSFRRRATNAERLSVPELGNILRAVEHVAPRVTPAPNTCLFRALARYAVLAEHGHGPVFVLGVRAPGEFPAHAWVEVGDQPFLEAAPPPFVSVFRQRAPA